MLFNYFQAVNYFYSSRTFVVSLKNYRITKALIILFFCLFNLAPLAYTAESNKSAELNNWLNQLPHIDLNNVKEGQTGYGLTVFQGYSIKKFQFTVIGVVKKFFNGSDAVLIKLIGPDFAKNNLIRGMSGSPVYIDGKLLGAVSFGFDFSTEPIVGVTPIKEMLDSVIEPVADKNSTVIDNDPISYNENSNYKISQNILNAKTISLLSPISMVGFSVRAQNYLTNVFKPYNVDLASGLGGGMRPDLTVKTNNSEKKILKPGSSASVLLSDGDFMSAATGTVTAVVNNKVLAFGHPFLQAGCVDFPMATSYVHTVVPSLVASVKLASPVNVIGNIFSDRPWSVGGNIGQTAKMVNATIVVNDMTRQLVKTYHVKIVNHPSITPGLLAASVMSAIDSTHQSHKPYVITVNSQFDINKYGKFEKSASFASNVPQATSLVNGGKLSLASDPVGSFVENIASKIYLNNFEPASLKDVNLTINIEDERKTAKIEEAYIDNNEVAPGQEIKIKCLIKPFSDKAYESEVKLKLPANLPDGDLLIGVGNGSDIKTLEGKFDVHEPPAQNLRQLLHKLFLPHENSSLNAVVALPYPKVVVNDLTFDNPPPTWFQLYFSNTDTRGIFVSKSKLSTTRQEPYILSGSHTLSVKVVNPIKYMAYKEDLFPDIVKSQVPSQSSYSTSAANKLLGSTTLNSAFKLLGNLAITETTNTKDVKDKGKEAAKKNENSLVPSFVTVNSDIYPHAPLTKQFVQGSYATFNDGTFKNTSVDSLGRLWVIPETTTITLNKLKVNQKPNCIAYCQGKLFIANGQEINCLNLANKDLTSIAQFKDSLITGLCFDKNNVLYAALSHDSKIIAFENLFNDNSKDKNNYKQIIKIDNQIINCLKITPDNIMYIGTSNPGRLYQFNLNDTNSKILSLETNSNHVTSISYNNTNKSVYIGTSQPAIVYKLKPEFKLDSIYQSSNSTITGIEFDASNNMYLATLDKGQQIKLNESGQVNIIGESQAFYTLFNSGKGIYAGDAEGDITLLANNEYINRPFFIPIKHTHTDSVISACQDDKNNLYMLSRNGNEINVIAGQMPASNYYVSPVFDAGDKAKWNKISLYNQLLVNCPKFNDAFDIEYRYGNKLIPDSTWSPYSKALVNKENSYFIVDTDKSRYFQYKLTFKDTSLNVARSITEFVNSNHEPYFTSVSLTFNQVLSKKTDITVVGHDPDNDDLILALRYSDDGGKKYTLIEQVVKNDNDKNAKSKLDALKAKDKTNKANSDKNSTKKNEAKLDATKANNESQDTDNKDSGDKDGQNNESDKKVNKDSDSSVDKESEKSINKNSDNKDGKNNESVKKVIKNADNKDDQDNESDKKAIKNLDNKDGKANESDKNVSKDSGNKVDQDKAADKKTSKGSDNKDNTDKEPVKKESVKKVTGDTVNSSVKTANTFKFEIDTTKIPDGKYLFRFDLSDKISNFNFHECAHYYLPVSVDNTKPEICDFNVTKSKEKKIDFTFTGKDNLAVYGASYKFDCGHEYAIIAQNENSSETSKTFCLSNIKLPRKASSLIVKVFDTAGNEAEKTYKIK